MADEQDGTLLPDGRKIVGLKVVDLKKELESRGLNKSGVKKELVQRLVEALSQEPVSIVGDESSVVDDSATIGQQPTQLPSPTILQTEAIPPPIDLLTETGPSMKDTNTTGHFSDTSTTEIPPPQEASALKKALVVEPPPSTASPLHEVVITSRTIPVDGLLHDQARPEEVEEEDYGDEEVEEEEEEVVSGAPSNALKEVSALLSQSSSDFKSQQVNGEEPTKVVIDHVKAPFITAATVSDTSATGPKETRGIGHLKEGPERLEPFVESKHPMTDLVYIRSLVRPFTAGQLTKMVEAQFGAPIELWLDKIKSSAVVRMPSQELAKSCREGLDGCRWPSINPRVLRCDFASEDLFAWLRQNGDAGDRVPPRHLLLGQPERQEDRSPNRRKRTLSGGDKSAARTLADSHSEKRRRLLGADAPTMAEVDGVKGSSAPAAATDAAAAAAAAEEPAMALDDLFKKTTAAPCIYWLPLSDEEAEAQKKRRVDRHTAETSRREAASRRNQGGQREARSPFAATASTAPPVGGDAFVAATAVANDATNSGRRSVPDKTQVISKPESRRDRSPFSPNRRRSRSPGSPRRRVNGAADLTSSAAAKSSWRRSRSPAASGSRDHTSKQQQQQQHRRNSPSFRSSQR